MQAKSSIICSPIQSPDAEVVLPPPALCRHEFVCSGSRCVLKPTHHLCLPQAWPVLAEAESQEKAQGLLALKALKASTCPRARVMPHMACLAASLRTAERHHVSTSRASLAAKRKHPSLGSGLQSCEVANRGEEGKGERTHQRSTCWCLACP